MYNPFDFTGKKIIVTGASSGIGRGVSVELSKQGAKVVLIGRNEERLDETLSFMDGEGHIKFCVDLVEEEDLAPLFKEITADGIKLSGLVHCAGVTSVDPVGTITTEKMDYCMRTNFYSYMKLVRQYSKKKFSLEGSSVVGISAVAATHPGKCQTLYSASKAAMNAAIKSIAGELASKRIRINNVMPGFVKTPMVTDGFETTVLGDRTEIDSNMSLQKFGIMEPKNIADVCMFLLSDASSSISGHSIYADNGLLL